MTMDNVALIANTKLIGLAKRLVRYTARKLGYDRMQSETEKRDINELRCRDFDEDMVSLLKCVQPFTMTSEERIYALRKSVEYVVKNEIPGDIVECGVWKGGSMMAVAKTLIENDATRTLYLFDTFEGMPAPQEIDTDFRGSSA